MSILTIKQPSEKLKEKLEYVIKHFRNCATLVDQALSLGLEEGFSKKEIGQMIRERLVQLGYDPRSIRRALPSSAKDLSKTRKDYLAREQHKNDSKSDEDLMSSYGSRNEFDEKQLDTTNSLQIKIKTLDEQLTEEHNKNEDLTIQCKNAVAINLRLRDQLKAVCNATRILGITKDNFPPDSSLVFSSEDHVFALKFKGTKILDISVMAQKEAQNIIRYEIDNLQKRSQ